MSGARKFNVRPKLNWICGPPKEGFESIPFRETETSDSEGEHNSKKNTASRLEGTNTTKSKDSPSPSSKR